MFESESKLLSDHGQQVETLLFDNDTFKTLLGKLTAAFGSIYNFESSRILRKKIKEFKPDIIHVHNFFHIASPSIFYTAKRYKVPIIMTLHNYRLICPSATLFFNDEIYEKSINRIFPLEAIFKGVYRNSRIETAMLVVITGVHKLFKTWNSCIDSYIALTQFARSIFLNSSLNVDATKITVKPNFVVDSGFNIQGRENFFLFVGRLSSEKGVSKLIEAAKNLPQIDFSIIGDGPLKNFVVDAAKAHKNIKYLGFQNKEFIIEQLKKSRALIFPSLWYEGFPMTILEAFSCGTPVLASDLGGPREIISNEKNGLLFNYKDPSDLVKTIKRIAVDDSLHVEMCENARKTYDDFSLAAQEFYKILKIAISRE